MLPRTLRAIELASNISFLLITKINTIEFDSLSVPEGNIDELNK